MSAALCLDGLEICCRSFCEILVDSHGSDDLVISLDGLAALVADVSVNHDLTICSIRLRQRIKDFLSKYGASAGIACQSAYKAKIIPGCLHYVTEGKISVDPEVWGKIASDVHASLVHKTMSASASAPPGSLGAAALRRSRKTHAKLKEEKQKKRQKKRGRAAFVREHHDDWEEMPDHLKVAVPKYNPKHAGGSSGSQAVSSDKHRLLDPWSEEADEQGRKQDEERKTKKLEDERSREQASANPWEQASANPCGDDSSTGSDLD